MMIRLLANSYLWYFRTATFLVAGIGGSSFTAAEVKSEPDALNGPIEKVLRAEDAGVIVDRRELLVDEKAEGSDEARWHSGEVWIDKKWMPFNEIDDSTQSALMKRYLKERGDNDLDVGGHRRMAGWCEERDLKMQADAHWFGVLDLSSNDLAARKKLKFQLVDGEWMTDDDIRDASIAAKEKMRSLSKWMPSMKRIAASIVGMDTKLKLKAIDELKAIKDIESVFAMGVTAAQLADDNAIPFIQTIRKFRSQEACETLARIALVDPSSKFGQVAIEGVKEYPMEFYVPNLISQLAGGSNVEFLIFKRANGERVLRQIHREHLRSFEKVAVIDSVLDRRIGKATVSQSLLHENTDTETIHSRRRGTTSVVQVRAVAGFSKSWLGAAVLYDENKVVDESLHEDAKRESERISAAHLKAKDEAKFRQDRIIWFLNICAGTDKISDSPSWWRWWDEYNERIRITSSQSKTYYLEDRSKAYTISSDVIVESHNELRTESASERYVSCLVAGTLIQTDRGLQDIKAIRQGDLVLSQNITTGELAMRPVIRTTVRPPAKTLVFETETGKVQATLGHFWWIAGRGWTRTKELEVGMRIHNASGTSTIRSIEEGLDVETYNLVVADNHNYFVGEERLLSYDATELTPTLQTVPGLPASFLVVNITTSP